MVLKKKNFQRLQKGTGESQPFGSLAQSPTTGFLQLLSVICASLRSVTLGLPAREVEGQPCPLPWSLPFPARCSPCWRCKAQARQAATPASSGGPLFSFGFPGGHSEDARKSLMAAQQGSVAAQGQPRCPPKSPSQVSEVSRATQALVGTEVTEAGTVFSYPPTRLGPRPLSARGQLRPRTGCVRPLKH